jgi:colicin import membrane protein
LERYLARTAGREACGRTLRWRWWRGKREYVLASATDAPLPRDPAELKRQEERAQAAQKALARAEAAAKRALAERAAAKEAAAKEAEAREIARIEAEEEAALEKAKRLYEERAAEEKHPKAVRRGSVRKVALAYNVTCAEEGYAAQATWERLIREGKLIDLCKVRYRREMQIARYRTALPTRSPNRPPDDDTPPFAS